MRASYSSSEVVKPLNMMVESSLWCNSLRRTIILIPFKYMWKTVKLASFDRQLASTITSSVYLDWEYMRGQCWVFTIDVYIYRVLTKPSTSGPGLRNTL